MSGPYSRQHDRHRWLTPNLFEPRLDFRRNPATCKREGPAEGQQKRARRRDKQSRTHRPRHAARCVCRTHAAAKVVPIYVRANMNAIVVSASRCTGPWPEARRRGSGMDADTAYTPPVWRGEPLPSTR